ncbi:MAG: hypothetical protein BGO77_02405 [Caedibacter sp. 37-49]|nr:MAG: hypothetical protein BGO77_02405 [Caedibacter sp. 37-49]
MVSTNNKGELINFKITLRRTDDRSFVQTLTRGFKGWLFGDKGYLNKKLAQTLKPSSIELITRLKRNIKNSSLNPSEKGGSINETLFNLLLINLKQFYTYSIQDNTQFKTIFANILSALLAYTLKLKKPSITFEKSILKMACFISRWR